MKNKSTNHRQKSYFDILDNLWRGQKLSRGSAEDKNFSFCSVPWLPVCPVPGTILKSNTVQLKLSYPIPYFLTDQTRTLILFGEH
jgi:hypothetical protein